MSQKGIKYKQNMSHDKYQHFLFLTVGHKRNGQICPKCNKIHKDMTGINNPTNRLEIREKIKKNQKGKRINFHHSLLSKQKISFATAKENNPNWQGGKSFEIYPQEFNKQLKEQIRKRDQYRCQECFRHQDELRTKTNKLYNLNIHHVDFNKKNNFQNNLISLCKNCHQKTNFNRNHWITYYKNKIII